LLRKEGSSLTLMMTKYQIKMKPLWKTATMRILMLLVNKHQLFNNKKLSNVNKKEDIGHTFQKVKENPLKVKVKIRSLSKTLKLHLYLLNQVMTQSL
jgi:hypothetical protein